jgi:hypothetical protein
MRKHQAELSKLDPKQQQSTITAEVARATGVTLGVVRQVLVAQWSALIEEQGRQLGRFGGGPGYRAGAQQLDPKSSAGGLMLEGKSGTNSVRTEKAVRAKLDDGRINKDDLDRLLAIVADGNPELALRSEEQRQQQAKTGYIDWGGRFGRDQQWDSLVLNAVHNSR